MYNNNNNNHSCSDDRYASLPCLCCRPSIHITCILLLHALPLLPTLYISPYFCIITCMY